MSLYDINTAGGEGNLENDRAVTQPNIAHCWNLLWVLQRAGLQSIQGRKKKKQMVNTESTTLWSAHQGDPGQANPMLRKSGAPLWSEQQAWSQPRGQASPSSAKGQSRGGGGGPSIDRS